jgi:hypothetical protein
MKLLGKTNVNGKQFTITDSEGTVYLKQLGIPDNWYGGYVKELRKTKYGIYLCLTKKGEIVNLMYTDESLTDEGRKLLGMEPLSEEEKTNKGTLIEQAKALGVKGVLQNMKEETLLKKIQEAQEK